MSEPSASEPAYDGRDPPGSQPALGRVCAISPHLDDAVLGCGALLARCHDACVVTVMAGLPPEGPPPPWDEACGFASGPEAMRARRHEDIVALGLLGAHACHLDFLDAQYGDPPAVASLESAIAARTAAADTVLIPMGLFHADHDLTHRAALCVWRRAGARQRWWAYEDVLYRRKPGLLQRRLAQLQSEGVRATPLPPQPARAPLKAQAVQAYASQLRGLGLAGHAGDTAAPEGYWHLERLDAA
ncbi:PIG-L deacetylase family protein [Verticiella sediminum]|nr:PIG-L family deacetylase [Verticiella sediminum]